MSDSPPPVTGTSHKEQIALTQKHSENQRALKMLREEVLTNQEKKSSELERVVVEERPQTSGYTDASQVKLSKAVSEFSANNRAEQQSNEFIDRAVIDAKVDKSQASNDNNIITDAFFQRMEKIQQSQQPTALDSHRGAIHRQPSPRQIDTFG
ncbi:MAG: hypothetical protein HQL72_01340 [Magnetococcales bacterium]|nr:hypothetical protein [Magnetococcales bacterium]